MKLQVWFFAWICLLGSYSKSPDKVTEKIDEMKNTGIIEIITF